MTYSSRHCVILYICNPVMNKLPRWLQKFFHSWNLQSCCLWYGMSIDSPSRHRTRRNRTLQEKHHASVLPSDSITPAIYHTSNILSKSYPCTDIIEDDRWCHIQDIPGQVPKERYGISVLDHCSSASTTAVTSFFLPFHEARVALQLHR